MEIVRDVRNPIRSVGFAIRQLRKRKAERKSRLATKSGALCNSKCATCDVKVMGFSTFTPTPQEGMLIILHFMHRAFLLS